MTNGTTYLNTRSNMTFTVDKVVTGGAWMVNDFTGVIFWITDYQFKRGAFVELKPAEPVSIAA